MNFSWGTFWIGGAVGVAIGWILAEIIIVRLSK